MNGTCSILQDPWDSVHIAETTLESVPLRGVSGHLPPSLGSSGLLACRAPFGSAALGRVPRPLLRTRELEPCSRD